jgi:prephenate dehydrogenase
MMGRPAPLPDTAEIAIIGLGLIGGSLARGLRAAGYAGRLTGAVAGADDVQRALELGLVGTCHATVSAAVAAADLIVVAVPPGAIPEVFAEIAAHRPAGAVVTDTASSKSQVIRAAAAAFDAEGLACFVPGHPIAGTEHNGLDAGFATLFQDRRVILTPTAATHAAAVARVETLWSVLGASVVTLPPGHHDDVLAATSHLPHVLAYTLVDTLASMAERTEVFAFAAGGFSDFTRIASSDPVLWRSIVAANREPVLQMIDSFTSHLRQVRAAIEQGDDAHL